jgi:hypothetical protein
MVLSSGGAKGVLLAEPRFGSGAGRPVRGPIAPGERGPWALSIGIAAVVAGVALTRSQWTQVVLLIGVVPFLLAVALRSPRHLVFVLAPWLVALGLLRRLLLGLGSHALGGDPLLLVEPTVVVLLAAVAFGRGAARDRSVLAKGVLALCVLALLEAVNPLQGGLAVGLGGLLFVLVPMLAFWVGRALVDEKTLRRLFLLIGALAVPAAAYGLIQTYVGFPAWDARWIQTVTATGTYAALDVGGVVRAFSSFSSSAEYASFLGIGIAVWFSWGRQPERIPVVLLGLALLGTAVVLESSRGVVVLSIVAVGVMAAAVARVRVGSAALWGIAAVSLLYLGVSHLSPTAGGAGPTAALLQHQIAGFSQPLNSESSTLGIHLSELASGLKSSITDPLGHGTGAITSAAAVFGGAVQGTEVDASNAGVAFGLPGLVAYGVVAIAGLAAAYRLASSRRDWLAVAALGVLVATFLQWLNGGQYAVAWLPWLVLGWVDRTVRAGGARIRPERLLPPASSHSP